MATHDGTISRIALLRRGASLGLAVLVALTWSESGRTQATACVIERGLDPLEVLSNGVRHNLWVVLDASGSMTQDFGSSNVSKLDVAKDVIRQLMAELVDASGRPLVNWAFANYDTQEFRNTSFDCTQPSAFEDPFDPYPEEPSFCTGLADASIVEPAACGEDSRDDVEAKLAVLTAQGGTPIGVSFDDISNYIIGRHPANTVSFVNNLLPGQKNFIVHVTDGQDTCECDELGYDTGSDTVAIRGSSTSPAVTETSTGSGDTRSYNAGLKGEVALRRIDPALDGSKGNIFVVGVDLDNNDKERTNHIAWTASGAAIAGRDPSLLFPAFFADEPEELVRAFRDILALVGVPEAEVSFSGGSVGTVRELVPLADPTISTADLDADGLSDQQSLALRDQFLNNVLVTTSVETPRFRGHVKLFNLFRVEADGTRVADFTRVWDAGELLRQRDAADRRVLFNRPVPVGSVPPEPLELLPANLTAADLGVAAGDFAEADPDGIGARTDEDAVEIVVRTIRGERLTSFAPLTFSELEEDGTRTWKLFDSASSTPAIVQNPPQLFDPPEPRDAYTDFANAQINRRTMVYVGTNGGTLEAFDATTGEELWAYVPPDLLPRLKDLVRNVLTDNNGITNHAFMLAASPTVSDAHFRTPTFGTAGFRTVLTIGRGKGGKFLSALDVTDPTSPRLVFNVGNRDGTTDPDFEGENYDGLGETWSLPVIGRVQTGSNEGQYVVFTGSGYGCPGTEEGKFLYVLRVEDGTVYRKLGPIEDATDAAIDDNALVATPALFSPHELGSNDGLKHVTKVFIGDLQGFVYRALVEDPDPSNWTFDVFFEVTSRAGESPGAGEHNQPITAAAAVVRTLSSGEILLFVGTGGDQRVSATEAGPFKMVGLKDTVSGTGPGQLLFTQTENEPFFFDLPAEERVFVNPVATRSANGTGVVFFASTKSVLDPGACQNTFLSTVTAVDIAGGLGVFDLDPATATVESSFEVESKITGLYHRDEHLYVSKSGGIGIDPGTEVRGSDTFPTPDGGGAAFVRALVESYRVSPF